MVRYYLIFLALVCSIELSAGPEDNWLAKSKETFKEQELAEYVKSSLPVISANGNKPLASKNTLSAKQQAAALSKLKDAIQHPVNADFWIYDAESYLLEDYDYDGFHYIFKVRFDVDTVFEYADVYARLYLGDGSEFREYHTTSEFDIRYDNSSDKFSVETELLSGYSPYDYDIMIEVYEADTDHLLAVYDHHNDADLSYLPLESFDNEFRASNNPRVTRSSEYGGSMSWFLLYLGAFVFLSRNLTR